MAPDFPRYDETELWELTLGVYQLRMARSYTQEHISVDSNVEIFVTDDIRGILLTKIQSRHNSANSIRAGLVRSKGS